MDTVEHSYRNDAVREARALDDAIMTWGVIPVCVLGIIGNVIMLWVWMGGTTFSPTTFLIKYIALCDALFLVANIVADGADLAVMYGCLPVLVMAVCNVAMVVKIQRDSGLASSLSQQSARRLTIGIICMTSTSLLAFPAHSVMLVVIYYRRAAADISIWTYVLCLGIGNILVVLNSSVNVIYWAVFATEFRHLFAKKFRKLRGRATTDDYASVDQTEFGHDDVTTV
nr:hypothetical protein BaRGS_022446 [Batillaria attramentaria]